MESNLKIKLTNELTRGGQAYIRNLAAAEQATLQGQFNIAKLLRATAHSQRIMAMEAARLLEEELDAQELLNVILEEIGVDKDLDELEHEDSAAPAWSNLRMFGQDCVTSFSVHLPAWKAILMYWRVMSHSSYAAAMGVERL